MHNPHTIGEVVRQVIDLSRPDNPNDIRLGRMHDGMIINLATRMMDSIGHEDITEKVVLHIRSIVGRYQSSDGIDVTSALEFLDNVRTAPEQPGIIGTIGGMVVRRMRSVLSLLKTTSSVTHAPEGTPRPTQGDAAGETA